MANIKTLKPNGVRKFYFLEYYYIALKSVAERNTESERLIYFKNMKNKFRLGESKYKILRFEKEGQEKREQISRYKYTFSQVLDECKLYEFVFEKNNKLGLTHDGEKCISLFDKHLSNNSEYKLFLLQRMEKIFGAFHHLLEICYSNSFTKQILFFPIYSPLKLGFDRSKFRKNKDIVNYIIKLTDKIESDVAELLSKDVKLKDVMSNVILKLINDGLINDNPLDAFDRLNYNIIVKRIRDFYLSSLLSNYGFPYSYDTFNVWTERGKKFGILHATDFFPGINGRIVFPTSILSKNSTTDDFNKVFEYFDREKLFIHSPSWEKIEEKFVKALIDSYFNIKRIRKTHFISLPDIKEKVCFILRISAYDFDHFIKKTYDYSIQGRLKVQISLEADKLPEETTAMYLKREPIIVAGKQKNIIAINFK